ncbi:hypothetical protein K2173_004172 [Erythroxylum novogranatense]|uniref:Uncharacterized protein n=1 Tax=Erythroxylum novogranatense TaxID=1862640 RepID=A0AAV8SYT7_9ROSI|nr:hypothetical protein K2173_004172 [Erythroxylum novogranatense]
MEVHIVSRETVKPSSPAIVTKKPYKLSLFDQLTPTTHTPIIFFYSKNRSNSNTTQVLARLERSLSETLDSYLFLSGRTRDNRFIDCFDEGVPFFEASVSVGLSDFLKHHEHEWLNRLVAYRPYTKEALDSPVLAIQVSVFACGGIAIGVSASRKLMDAHTGSFFFKTWAAMCRGDVSDGINPQVDEASMYFPTRDSFPQNHLSQMESLWFTEANYVTRSSIGDLLWWATATSNNDDSKSTSCELAKLLKEAIELYDMISPSLCEETKVMKSFTDLRTARRAFSSKSDIFALPVVLCWFYKAQFWLGEPIWVGAVGKVGLHLEI